MITRTLSEEQQNAVLYAIDQEVDRAEDHMLYLKSEAGQKEEGRDRQLAETETLLRNLKAAREVLN